MRSAGTPAPARRRSSALAFTHAAPAEANVKAQLALGQRGPKKPWRRRGRREAKGAVKPRW